MEVVRLLRNVFLRAFLVAAILGFVFAIATFAAWDAGISFVTGHFHTDAATVTPIALQCFSQLRFFIWFGLLTPGLALHWTLKAEEKRAQLSGERTI
jgi:hypothetical protein